MILSMPAFPKPEPATLYCQGYHETVGSTGAGKALCLHKLGADTMLLATAGWDKYGELIARYLQREGLPFYLDQDPDGTERHVNLMDAEGKRISIFINTASPYPLLDLRRTENEIMNAEFAVLNINGYCKAYLPLLRKHNKEIWCDLHDYDGGNPYHDDFIASADYLFLSSDNLPGYRPVMERWIACGKKLVVCTHGRGGATALAADGRWYEIPIADQYERVDSNGAGDNFFSGFLYAYSLGCPLDSCLQAATICAGLCITSKELVSEGLSADKLRQNYERYYGEVLL
jgi:sugar/nucleoside kinase (ribokinase family)